MPRPLFSSRFNYVESITIHCSVAPVTRLLWARQKVCIAGNVSDIKWDDADESYFLNSASFELEVAKSPKGEF